MHWHLYIGDATTDERRDVVDENLAAAVGRHVFGDVGGVEPTCRRLVGDVDENRARLGERTNGVDADAKQISEISRDLDDKFTEDNFKLVRSRMNENNCFLRNTLA